MDAINAPVKVACKCGECIVTLTDPRGGSEETVAHGGRTLLVYTTPEVVDIDGECRPNDITLTAADR